MNSERAAMEAKASNKLHDDVSEQRSYYLQKFRLYETRSKLYMIGRDKDRRSWRVLKIDRLDPNVLTIHEDSTVYSETECFDLLTRIHEGNRPSGGLKLVTGCYGIIGFVKILGTYYIYVITKRMKIGAIGPHTIYAIAKREMISLQCSSGRTKTSSQKAEEKYKRIFFSLDLTKDFYFSYSYHVMRSLQKNLCEGLTGEVIYEKMFVWNEYLTRGIRHQLKNTLWTVALVHGFFKQVKLSLSGRSFKLTLIARRSRHYAGTRYLKRGVNEKGRVANDVETEQIVFEDAPERSPVRISSVVQNRGSIPLFWAQETSRLNIKPDIMLSEKNKSYEATRLHFENLYERYGNPIIILNLIKTRERKPRESLLRAEFANAIEFINKDLPEESRLKFVHWDLHKHCRSKNKNVLAQLGKLASNALNFTGFFYCQVTPELAPKGSFKWKSERNDDNLKSSQIHCDDDIENVVSSEKEASRDGDINGDQPVKSPMFQNGVLRTNCIDCLDRTNVAQYSYGLAALGHQLHALGLIDVPKLDLSSPLADDLMRLYEAMGDTLALQYGGSPAHNKIFSERRGHWKAAIQSQELFRTLQRYYSNAYMDAEKQAAINLFLGHFQPQEGKPALWELDSDQHCNVGTHDHTFGGARTRVLMQFFRHIRALLLYKHLYINPFSGTLLYKPGDMFLPLFLHLLPIMLPLLTSRTYNHLACTNSQQGMVTPSPVETTKHEDLMLPPLPSSPPPVTPPAPAYSRSPSPKPISSSPIPFPQSLFKVQCNPNIRCFSCKEHGHSHAFCYLHDFPSPLPRPYSHTYKSRRRFLARISRKKAQKLKNVDLSKPCMTRKDIPLRMAKLHQMQTKARIKALNIPKSVEGQIDDQEQLEGEGSYNHSEEEVQSKYRRYGNFFQRPTKRKEDSSTSLQAHTKEGVMTETIENLLSEHVVTYSTESSIMSLLRYTKCAPQNVLLKINTRLGHPLVSPALSSSKLPPGFELFRDHA